MLVAVIDSSTALTQEDSLSPQEQCLRYILGQERALHIPQGLLAAISLAEAGRSDNGGPLQAWPWTINVNNRGQFFETKEEAVAATRKLLDEGQRSIDVGCMQVNLRYHPNAFRTIEDAFDLATNVAYGAKFLASLHDLQGSWPKAVERYHSSEDGRREQYRDKVIALWNSEARNIIMNAVLAEDTDTPYHRAVNDFISSRYSEALDKYQAIVDKNPKDRIGLLGVAMSYEKLDRKPEAFQAYMRYLTVEPTNENIISKVVQDARAKTPGEARADLEAVVKAGVTQPEIYAALSEITNDLGDNEAALSYATSAAKAAPSVPAYNLNAGIIADKMNRPIAAVQYYERFLALFTQKPTLIDTSIDGVRARVAFLRKRI